MAGGSRGRGPEDCTVIGDSLERTRIGLALKYALLDSVQ